MPTLDNAFLTYACNILADTELGLTGSKIAEHCVAFSVDWDVAIPYTSYPFPKAVPNKRSALLANISRFSDKQQYQIISSLCKLPEFAKNQAVHELKSRLYIKYGHLAEDGITSSELVVKTRHWLDSCPSALKAYNDSLEKFENGIYERNTLDDMRLAFEFLVKNLLKNDRSLENNINDIGAMLKTAGASVELRNMCRQIITYYTDFQNHHIKHEDQVNPSEVEYVIELTSVIMKFLIKMLGVV